MSYLEELLPEFRKGAKIRKPEWSKEEYIYINKSSRIVDEVGDPFELNGKELFEEWEFYTEPQLLDWDYIIKNKCLCWFWNYDCIEGYRTVGILSSYDKGCTGKFQIGWFFYKHCRPVRRDEVTFYEDRKDD